MEQYTIIKGKLMITREYLNLVLYEIFTHNIIICIILYVLVIRLNLAHLWLGPNENVIKKKPVYEFGFTLCT